MNRSVRFFFYFGFFFCAICLIANFLKLLTCTAIRRCILYCKNNVFVVKVGLTKDIDVRTTLMLRVVIVVAVVVFAAFVTLCSLFFLFCYAVSLFL